VSEPNSQALEARLGVGLTYAGVGWLVPASIWELLVDPHWGPGSLLWVSWQSLPTVMAAAAVMTGLMSLQTGGWSTLGCTLSVFAAYGLVFLDPAPLSFIIVAVAPFFCILAVLASLNLERS
jgi:hypothetical protein